MLISTGDGDIERLVSIKRDEIRRRAPLHIMAGGLSGHSSETNIQIGIAGYLEASNFQSILGLWVAA